MIYRNKDGKLVHGKWWEGFLPLAMIVGIGCVLIGVVALANHPYRYYTSWAFLLGGFALFVTAIQISLKKGIL